MRKVCCVLLGCLLIVSGCSEHISAHCLNHSDEISLSPDLRNKYHPILTPITDVAGECYCQVEDASIIALAVPVMIVCYGIVVLLAVGGEGSVANLLQSLSSD